MSARRSSIFRNEKSSKLSSVSRNRKILIIFEISDFSTASNGKLISAPKTPKRPIERSRTVTERNNELKIGEETERVIIRSKYIHIRDIDLKIKSWKKVQKKCKKKVRKKVQTKKLFDKKFEKKVQTKKMFEKKLKKKLKKKFEKKVQKSWKK